MAATKPIEKKPQRPEPGLIERPRLLKTLDDSDARIIALIAPAGFGKTTLARQWVSSRNIAYAWYSVGPEGFDVAAVAARIAAIVSTVVAGAGEPMLTRLSVSTDPEADAVLLAELLGREIACWPLEVRLVIDDYQALAISHACERFVETLVHETPLRLLVTSRKRPSWASSRLRLYGELFEIRRNELEMTPEEALEVLTPIADEEQRTELVEVCHGWPAVLGLAARSQGSPLPKNALLPGLFDYFAEELYKSASADLQRFLCQVSAVPSLTRDLLERLDGASALELAEVAERRGFVHTDDDTGERSLHPLLRAFLAHRLDERSDRVRLVDDLTDVLLASERWDDVWQVIQDRRRPDLLPRLIESSLPTLLDGSRLPALESWAEFGRENQIASPLLDLAEAEMAFLAGDHAKAYALAFQATHHFDESSPLLWRAHAIAGRSAHFADHLDVALDHMRKARALAPDRTAVQHCLWTEFLCAYELENEDCVDLLDQLRSRHDGRPETTVRIAQGTLLLSDMVGIASYETARPENAFALLDRVHPQIRASFVVAYCDRLIRSARYSEADTALTAIWPLLTDFGFAFGLPLAFCERAAIAIGLRHYRHAELLLDAATQSTPVLQNSICAYVRSLRIIIRLAKGEVRPDIEPIDESIPKCWLGVSLSINALGQACHGNTSAALDLASRAEATTRHAETHALTGLTRAVIAARSESTKTIAILSDAIALITKHGTWNQLVWAYRAYPELLTFVASEPKLVVQIQQLVFAHDEQLATRFAIPIPNPCRSTPRSSDRLSPREREVLQLVADGLSNNEISKKLFISEVTVKVHLRHIYEKLGVRNRVEAALHTVYSE